MRYLKIFILACLMISCATPQKADLLVRYPVKGEIVWVYSPGSTDQDPQIIVDYEDLKEFIEWLENEKE